MSRPRIELRGPIGWGDRVLFYVEKLVLEPPGVTCVLGPNGSGKTTLLKTLGGVIEGKGAHIEASPPGLERAYSPPYPPVDSGLDGWSLLSIATGSPGPLSSPRVPGGVARALGYLEELGLPQGGLSRPLSRMSTGEAMKVLLSGIIASRAQALFLDEPNGHLDLASRSRLYSILSRASVERIVVVSLHDVGEAAQACRRVFLLSREGPVAWGDAGEVLVPGLLEKAYGISFQLVELRGGRRVPLPLLGESP